MNWIKIDNMHDTTIELYQQYLGTTGDKSAAAALTLADVMQRTLDANQLPPKPLTVPEVAQLLHVCPSKVQGWIGTGQLLACNVTAKPGGRPRYRIAPSALADFTRQRLTKVTTPVGRPVGRRRPAYKFHEEWPEIH